MLRLAPILTLTLLTASGVAHSSGSAGEPATSSEPAAPEPEAGDSLAPKEPFSTPKPDALQGEEPVLVEACDGSRKHPTQDASLLVCRRWSVAWHERGAAWGRTSAASYDAVLAERERQLGFVRQYARFFEPAPDERYADPSPPICEVCDAEVPAGRWGEGQKFGDAAARQALTAAEAELAALDVALREHAPRLTEAARLSRDPTVGKAARAYAKALRQGMQRLAQGRLALDDAGVLRSERAAKDAGRAASAQVEALASSLGALRKAVAKEVTKAHAGRYVEDGAPGPDLPYLQVEIDGIAVTATYFVGEARSTWFQGEVELDGSIAGRSLVAPEGGATTCTQHSEACGFVYIPAVLRFVGHADAEGQPVQTAELWFQRSAWAMAKPFSRRVRGSRRGR
jgi:hypothetical protein